jgi:hypothetical protein
MLDRIVPSLRPQASIQFDSISPSSRFKTFYQTICTLVKFLDFPRFLSLINRAFRSSMSAPTIAWIVAEGSGTTVQSKNNKIRMFSDTPEVIMRGVMASDGAAVTTDKDDFAATVNPTAQTGHQSQPQGMHISCLVLASVLHRLRRETSIHSLA